MHERAILPHERSVRAERTSYRCNYGRIDEQDLSHVTELAHLADFMIRRYQGLIMLRRPRHDRVIGFLRDQSWLLSPTGAKWLPFRAWP